MFDLLAVRVTHDTQLLTVAALQRWVDDKAKGRKLIESKLRRRALLLSGPQASKVKTAKPAYAGGRRSERRAAEWTERRKREAELSTWEDTAALRSAWRTYASVLETRPEVAHKIAPSLDFHGAVLAVIKSPIESYVGICGVVVEETQQTFRILEWRRNKIKALQKRGLVFALVFHDPGIPTASKAALVLDGQPFIDRCYRGCFAGAYYAGANRS